MARILAPVLLVPVLVLSSYRDASGASGDISTVVGPVGIGSNIQATSVNFSNSLRVALDSSGNTYISDTFQNRIHRVDAVTNVVTTIAGTGAPGFSGDSGDPKLAQLSAPAGIAFDGSGNLYFADSGNHRIRRLNSTFTTITTVAGGGNYSVGLGDGGSANAAYLANPQDVAVHPASGDILVADTYNHRIRMFTPGGNIDTVAGTTSGNSGDGGAATGAKLSYPSAIGVNSAGTIFVADSNNNLVRTFVLGGTITTIAGGGASSAEGVSPTSAVISYPADIDVDAAGNVYIAAINQGRVRKVTKVGSSYTSIDTVAGGGPNLGSPTALTGVPAVPVFLQPTGVAVTPDGSKFSVADRIYQQIRRVDTSTGVITTFAGSGTFGKTGESVSGTNTRVREPAGLVVDRSGNLYFSDAANHRIRRLSNGIVTTIAGTGSLGNADGNALTEAQFQGPRALAIDPTSGSIYVTDGYPSIRKISNGVVTTIAGDPNATGSADGSAVTTARFNGPRGMAVDASGNIYVADTQNNKIRMISNGIVSTVAGTGASGSTGDGGPATLATLNAPEGVAVDSSGNIYVADTQNHRIRKFTVGGNIVTVAGDGTVTYSGEGTATSVSLYDPIGLALDADNDLFVTSRFGYRVRKLDVSSGTISTVAGTGSYGYYGDGGMATSALLYEPESVAVDYLGNLYISDLSNHRIRKVETVAAPVPTTTAPSTTTTLVIPRKVGLAPKTVAISIGMSVPKGAKVTIAIKTTSKKTCYLKKSKLLSKKTGVCRFTVSVKPTKGATKRKISLLPTE